MSLGNSLGRFCDNTGYLYKGEECPHCDGNCENRTVEILDD